MSIPEEYHFDKSGEVVRFPSLRKYFLTLLIALISLLSYGVGRLSGPGRAGVSIINPNDQIPSSKMVQNSPLDISSSGVGVSAQSAAVYASSKGTKYYYLGCKSTISERNKITFATAKEAEAAGYALAATCKP